MPSKHPSLNFASIFELSMKNNIHLKLTHQTFNHPSLLTQLIDLQGADCKASASSLFKLGVSSLQTASP